MSRLRSYSQLSTYLECPAKYRAKYLDGALEAPAWWTVGGTAFHLTAEWLLDGRAGLHPDPDSMWSAAWQLAYGEATERNPLALSTPHERWRSAGRGKEDAAWWAREGPAMVRRFIDWRAGPGATLTPLAMPGGPALERRFEVELGGVPVVAIPDALMTDEHGQLVILDYKSGRKEPGGSLQLGVYKAAVLAALGLDAPWGMYYLTRGATVGLRDLTSWSTDEIGRMFAEFDANVAAGRFPPSPTCKFRDLCAPAHEKESP